MASTIELVSLDLANRGFFDDTDMAAAVKLSKVFNDFVFELQKAY